MYCKILRIIVLGTNPIIEQGINLAAVPERFELTCRTLEAANKDALQSCDFVVADGLDRLREVLALSLSADFRLILCVSPDEIPQLTDADYAALHNIWTTPLSCFPISFLFGKLLESEKTQADLFLTKQYLDTMIDSIPELVWFKDAKGAHLKANRAFCETVEKTKEQVEGRGHYYIWDLTPEEYSKGEFICLESEATTMEGTTTCLFDELIKTKSGMRQFKTYKSPLLDFDGSPMGTVGVAHDVTDLRNIETELDIFINSMPYAIVVLDTEENILNLNNNAEIYFNVQRANAIGDNFDKWRRIALTDVVVDTNDFSDASSFTATIRGQEKTFIVNQQMIHDVFGSIIGQVRIYRDITKERELEQRVLKSANTDYLTGLYNRRYLYSHLEQHKGEPVSVLYFDLDEFKGVNDAFGHQAGDRVLITTSKVLTEVFPDDTVSRAGGDEFIVVVLGAINQIDLEEKAQLCLERLSTRLAEELGHATTGSLGIAYDKEASLALDELIHRGDVALYAAKRSGKSQWRVWSPELEG